MLLSEHAVRPFHGTLLQLGRQDIYFDYPTLEKLAKAFSVKLRKPDKIVVKKNPFMSEVEAIDDVTFFQAIGFDSVKSLDASEYEKADLIWDFNLPVPQAMHDQFDAIYDGGTLEHVFQVGTAFFNIAAMLKVGGRAIHHAPTHNYVDHGFYCLSPTLFCDFYEANKFVGLKCHLIGNRLPFSHNEVPKIFDYTPGMMEGYSVGGLDGKNFDGCAMFSTHFYATKTVASTATAVPMQRRYREWWEKNKPGLVT